MTIGRDEVMEAGALRHRVVIAREVVTRDAIGAPASTWATVATVWAAVEDLAGREFLEAFRESYEVSTRIRVRWRSDVTAGMRVTDGSAVYHVKAALDVKGEERELQLMCKRVE